MATVIYLFGNPGGHPSAPGVNLNLLKDDVPLPASATWRAQSGVFYSFQVQPTTTSIWSNADVNLSVLLGMSIIAGDLEIRQTTEVLDFTPEQGYLQNLHYEWTRNDNSTIDEITYGRDDGPVTRIVFDGGLPYSQVADLAIVDFITDGTEIHGTPVADTLAMTNFSEVVLGHDGNDRIAGLGGDDLLHGGNHDDTLDGGAGNDLIDGGDGLDTADYSTAAAGVSLNLAQGRATSGTELDRLVSIENVVGSSRNDVLIGDGADNVIAGAQGDDRLDGGGGQDALSGGAGTDRLDGGEGNDTLAGENGDDVLFGGTGDDVIEGGAGSDRLYGGDGEDRLVGGAGADRLTGGAGEDTFVFTSTFDGPDQLLDFTSGTDMLEINRAGFNVDIHATLMLSSDQYVWEVVGSDAVSQGILFFDPASGWLRWDPTLDDPEDAIHLATLSSGELTIDDFLLV